MASSISTAARAAALATSVCLRTVMPLLPAGLASRDFSSSSTRSAAALMSLPSVSRSYPG